MNKGKMKLFSSPWTSKYLFALFVTALLFLVISVTLEYAIDTQMNSAAMINLSGRQRMLTKDIVLKGLLAVANSDAIAQQNARQQMLSAAAELETINSWSCHRFRKFATFISEPARRSTTRLACIMNKWSILPLNIRCRQRRNGKYVSLIHGSTGRTTVEIHG